MSIGRSTGESVAHWKATVRGVVFKKCKVAGQCGSKPWMATAVVLRKVYASFK